MSHTRIPDTRWYDGDTYWARESRRILEALQSAPTSTQLAHDLAHAEKMRELAYQRDREQWEREQERAERDVWLEEMAGAPGFEH